MFKKILLLLVIFSLFVFVTEAQSAEKDMDVAADEKEAVEENVLDSKKALRLQYFGDELLALNTGTKGLRNIVKINDEKMIMKKYDEKMRLYEEIIWKSEDPEKSPDMLYKKTEYQYNGDLFTPKIITENYIVDNQKTVSVYNDLGKILTRTDFDLSEEKDKVTETQMCRMIWKYDEENRLKEERTIKEKFVAYTRYLYHDGISKPDEYYYENSMLMKQKKYETEDTYVLTVYFDEETSVYSRFENDTKINEIYYINGKEVRRREF